MFGVNTTSNSLFLRKKKLLVPAILLFLFIIHLTVYITLDYVRGGEIEHPDSQYYNVAAEILAERWKGGDFSLLRYPEFANFVAIVYYFTGPSIPSAVLINLILHLASAFIAYHTIKNLKPSKYIPKNAPIIALFIVGLDPWAVYLSTQLLKDTYIIFSTALVILSLTLKSVKMRALVLFIALTILSILRYEYGSALILVIVFYIVYKLIRLSPSLKIVISEVGLVLLMILPLLTLNIVRQNIYFPPLGGSRYAEFTAEKFQKIAKRPNWVVGEPHIEFYENRSPVYSRPGCTPIETAFKNIPYCSATIIRNVTQILFYPYPWTADTPIEIAFAIYMLSWYSLLVIFLISYLVKPGPEIAAILFILGLILLTPLSLYIVKQSAFVRWRAPAQYILEIAMVASIAKLLIYEHTKRAIDILFSLSLLVLTLPLFIVIALTNKLLNVPIFFSQIRAGYEENPITIYKFTTLIKTENSNSPPPEGLAPSAKGMQYTKVGKLLRSLALDELPQLVSVLTGKLTLVGPRALDWELHSSCKRNIDDWSTRTKVVPGITGLAQLNTDRLDNSRRLWYDMQYINSSSLVLDLQLIVKGLVGSVKRKWR